MKTKTNLNNWGLTADSDGELLIHDIKVTELAEEFGTPLHVLNESHLEKTARSFIKTAEENYKGNVTIHYAFKCNHVPAVIEIIKLAGLQSEVMTEFEYKLALMTGYKPSQIIANGPCKTESFLTELIKDKIKLIIVDSKEELGRINSIACQLSTKSDILIRVNPDYRPKGIIKSAASGSRNSVFGMDLNSSELTEILLNIRLMEGVNFKGFHFHIGSGIEKAKDYAKVILKLKNVINFCREKKLFVRVLDVGGGYHSGTSRELSSKELFLYHALNIFQGEKNNNSIITFDQYASVISRAVESIFRNEQLPELIYEPGRCITSSNQFLLIKIHYTKKRNNKKWLITDGGLGTVTLPLFYEHHNLLLCNDVFRKPVEKVTITGPCCFPSDVVYRNILMPHANAGEILAVMDSGAYFTQLESSFGYPHPPVVSVCEAGVSIVRKRESFEDYISRDIKINQEYKNEIYNS